MKRTLIHDPWLAFVIKTRSRESAPRLVKLAFFAAVAAAIYQMV